MSSVPAAISKTIARNSLVLQKNSPGLLFGAGIVGVIGSTVLACRATLKMDEVLEEAKEKLVTSKTLQHREYTERDRQKDITLIYVQTSVKIVRAYGPAVILGGLSIAMLTSSHNMLSRRNAALTAAYGALEKGFAEYRARVIEKYGEDEDRNLRYGSKTEVVKEGKVTHQITRVGSDEPSIYARFFDKDTSASWSKEPEYNLIFLKCQQNYANDLLKSRGHVFLNDVYDLLGFERSTPGSVVGWIGYQDKQGVGDDYIDFGIFTRDKDCFVEFVNGFEGAVLLDFNVDGVIYDKIEEK
jgi:hypothetical protein